MYTSATRPKLCRVRWQSKSVYVQDALNWYKWYSIVEAVSRRGFFGTSFFFFFPEQA